MAEAIMQMTPLSEKERRAILPVIPGAESDAEKWELVSPIPEDAPKADFIHGKFGKPKTVYAYRDESGRLISYVVRYDPFIGSKRSKEILPLSYCEHVSGKQEWRNKWPSTPRPLYGLELLAAHPSAPIVITEGEKACEAARHLFPDHVVMTSPAGSNAAGKADWSKLKNKTVIIWPDADDAGEKYALEVKQLALKAGAACVAIISIPDNAPKGWDAADALAEGYTPESVRTTFLEGLEYVEHDTVASGASGGKPASAYTAADPEGDEKPQRVSQKDVLIYLALDGNNGIELFHDKAHNSYATFYKNGHYETWPIRSKNFRLWLQYLFWKDRAQSVSSQAMEEALRTLEALAINEGKKHDIFLRAARKGDKLYIDLGREDWKCVEITASGWRVMNCHHVKFIRCGGTGAMPLPEGGGSIENLKYVLNIPSDRDFKLVIAWMLAALRPGYAYPLLVVQGEQGTGKTFFCQRIRELIDPHQSLLRALPSKEEDLIASATSNLVLAYDNISSLSANMSDALCRVSTGGGFAKRALYTDNDEMVVEIMRPQLINGIEDIASRPDLNERAIIINLPVIPKEERQDTEALMEQFHHIRPGVFGALCDGLSAALANLYDVTLESKPRMADFAKFVTAAESAYGWNYLDIMNAYNESREEALETSIETNPLINAVTQFMTGRMEFEGTVQTLLGYLKEKVDSEEARYSGFPKTPNHLTRQLRRNAPLMRKAGIEYVHGVKTEHGRVVILRKL